MSKKQLLDPIIFATEVGELFGLGKETSRVLGLLFSRLYGSGTMDVLFGEQRDDPYELLGLSPSAPDEVLLAAYRAYAKLFHPDNGRFPDEKRMAIINVAYEKIKKMRRR